MTGRGDCAGHEKVQTPHGPGGKALRLGEVWDVGAGECESFHWE